MSRTGREKRAALVTHAVTRGLDPTVKLKPSGLDWLGDVPEHWRIMRFKHFSRIGNGSTPSRENPEYWEGGTYPWLNSSVVGDRTVQEESRSVTETALRECHLPIIEPPALLVAITGQGKSRGRSTVLNFEATINQHLAYVKAIADEADCFYLNYLMDTAYEFIRSDSDGAGSTRGAITCEQLGNFRVPLPPLPEQVAILDSIRQRTQRFDSLEHATVLVTGYVYGDNGMIANVTDPKGIVSHTLQDALGRTLQTIEDYGGANKTTLYTYGAAGMTSLTAVNADLVMPLMAGITSSRGDP